MEALVPTQKGVVSVTFRDLASTVTEVIGDASLSGSKAYYMDRKVLALLEK